MQKGKFYRCHFSEYQNPFCNFFSKKNKKKFCIYKKCLYICNVKIDKTDCTDLQNIKI